jgi:hypothetical protein
VSSTMPEQTVSQSHVPSYRAGAGCDRAQPTDDERAVFNAAMLERTAAFAPSVAASYDFSDIRTVVDSDIIAAPRRVSAWTMPARWRFRRPWCP